VRLAARDQHGRLVRDFEKASGYHDTARELASTADGHEPKFTDRRRSIWRSMRSGLLIRRIETSSWRWRVAAIAEPRNEKCLAQEAGETMTLVVNTMPAALSAALSRALGFGRVNSLRQCLAIHLEPQSIMGDVRNFGHAFSHTKHKQNAGVASEGDARIALFNSRQCWPTDHCLLTHCCSRDSSPTASLVDVRSQFPECLFDLSGQSG